MDGICVSVIDVGKGDCILVEADGMAGLIDTGYDRTVNQVLSFLAQRKVENLAWVVITHYDGDHTGGIREIGGRYGIEKLYLPAYEGSDKNYRTLVDDIAHLGLSPQRVLQAQRFTLGRASLSVFPSQVRYDPRGKGGEGNDNDLSLVITLEYGSDSYLFAGDIEKEGTDGFLRVNPGNFDVLKVPHHGNGNPLSDELFEAIRPKIAIITDSGKEPADKKTLKLLDKLGVEVYRTSTHGTVCLRSSGNRDYSISRA